MPKYTFKCCFGHTVQKIVSSKVLAFPCEGTVCSAVMERQLPVSKGAADVNEVINKYTGITWKKDQPQLLKERRDEYYWSVEVPRLVQSGTYSVETMLENGWIYLDDNNQVQINTKPPALR